MYLLYHCITICGLFMHKYNPLVSLNSCIHAALTKGLRVIFLLVYCNILCNWQPIFGKRKNRISIFIHYLHCRHQLLGN